MLKFHNKVCDHLAASGVPAGEIFAQARQMVTWHYQWMVLHDFVERITEKGIVAKILDQGRRFYRFKKTPYMPVEFSAAAYRFGHSMVREVYSHNRKFTPAAAFRHARSAVQVHRPVGRNHRRPRARSGAAPAADPGAFQQLDHRLAPLL